MTSITGSSQSSITLVDRSFSKRLFKHFIIIGYTESTVPVIIAYCILFIIAGGGNAGVVVTLIRSKRHRRSRVSLMIFNLAVADLMVALIMIPLEVCMK